jgi:predicted negative regulator of RcsB-dependent stress response
MSTSRFLEAAQRVLDADESTDAADQLKRVVVEDHPGDERYAELVEVLERYVAGQETVAEKVRTIIRQTIADVA